MMRIDLRGEKLTYLFNSDQKAYKLLKKPKRVGEYFTMYKQRYGCWIAPAVRHGDVVNKLGNVALYVMTFESDVEGCPYPEGERVKRIGYISAEGFDTY